MRISLLLLTAGETENLCLNIDYFPKEEYSPDPNDSTLSIPCKHRHTDSSIYLFFVLFTFLFI